MIYLYKTLKSIFIIVLFYSYSYGKTQPNLLLEIDKKEKKEWLDSPLNTQKHEIIFHFPQIPNATYQYQLIGVDTRKNTSLYPEIRYTNLGGGNYKFVGSVQVADKAIYSYEKPFVIEHSFYEKWWFIPSIGIYALLVFGIAFYLFSLYDLRNKLKVQFIRNQIAADLHDEVGSNLNSIAIFIEVLRSRVEREKPELLSILDKITANSEETVSLMRETVWAINPENDSTEKLLERMEALGFEVLSLKKIDFDFKNNLENQSIMITMEQRRNAYLIYKEAINNIVKHANATKVWVNIYGANNQLIFIIKDNGCGFDANQVFEGNGLKNFQHRTQNKGIVVEIDSIMGSGTTIKMSIVVLKNHQN